MTTNIDDLGINELEELTKRAQVLIEQKQRAKIDDAYVQLLKIAESVNMSLTELVEYGVSHVKTTEKRSVAPRYANPANAAQTWTGRGKQPRWVVDALESGKKIDDLLIK